VSLHLLGFTFLCGFDSFRARVRGFNPCLAALLKACSRRSWPSTPRASTWRYTLSGVDRIERNFEPMQRQVESWRQTQLTDVQAKLIFYSAFVDGAPVEWVARSIGIETATVIFPRDIMRGQHITNALPHRLRNDETGLHQSLGREGRVDVHGLPILLGPHFVSRA